MATLNVRNVPEHTHRAIRMLAAEHGRSMEAEVRAILELAIQPKEPVRLGSMLAKIGQDFGGVDLDLSRDPAAAEPAPFE